MTASVATTIQRHGPGVLNNGNDPLAWPRTERDIPKEVRMFLVRDIMYCKPGQARAMVKKFLGLSQLMKAHGFGPMRVMTDVSAERYWTVVSEVEVDNLEKYTEESRKTMQM